MYAISYAVLARKSFFAFLIYTILLPVSGFASETRELVFLNWSEYMDPELIKKFEKEYNAKVVEVFFESDDARDDMMVSTDAAGIDVALINGISIVSYKKAGWIEKLDKKRIPNLKHIKTEILNAFPDSNAYAVPYFYGTIGIAYRSDLTEKPESWMNILRPKESLHGKIAMTNDTRDMFGAALKALGQSVNSPDKEKNQEAAELLRQQKPYVKTYTYLSLDEDSALVNGEIIAALFYNGDALLVAEHNDAIKYTVPKEGTNLWIDYLVVMKESNKKDLAYKFINFLNEPENAAQLAEYVYYATPNRAAEKLVSDELKDDPVVYPGNEVLENSEYDDMIPARIQKYRNAVMSELLQKK